MNANKKLTQEIDMKMKKKTALNFTSMQSEYLWYAPRLGILWFEMTGHYTR